MKTRLLIILVLIVTILLIPLIAMQFTNEVNWSAIDFIAMGFLLLITGFLCELVFRIVTNTRHRVVLLIAVIVIFLLVWAELAVGIFGTPFAGN